ncbi:uncharacterized protein PRCAT00002438001 [Priceomyces carsonii]|uniref:uncharacterized protein n=1 Tax=Priceomyces carsonii TaxID=28549 RepID=UPI002ED8F8FA|nr:unnamed protein product [Priceomyces carsonii]
MTGEIQDQSQRLPKKILFTALGCLTASLFVSFFDQTAITTAIPSISDDLGNAQLLNSWIGSSYLIANTNFQLLYGRFSDIFGRKQVLLFSLFCLFFGNLISGFSRNPEMLFVFRGISGMGGGGINCLVMISFSDLLSTRERGKYFGFVAASTALGNGLGPLIGGVLSLKASWRWVLWITCPISVLSGLLVIFFVPLKQVSGSFKEKLRLLDWAGFLSALVSIILCLVSVSGGGESWSWSSCTFIVLIVISVVAFVVFVISEKFSSLPMIPLNIFCDLQKSILFLICFIMGWAYFVDMYYYPLYLQNVRGWSPIMSGLLQLPATCSSSIFGIAVGFINSKTGYYVRCVWLGGALWCLGTGLKIMFKKNSHIGLLIGSNLIQGLGIAFTFQPTLLALLSHSSSEQRAVVTGLRNFFRCLGGAVGIICSGIIFREIFKKRLNSILDDKTLIDQIISNPSLTQKFTSKYLRDQVMEKYLNSFTDIMISLTAVSGFMLLTSLIIKDGKDDENKLLPDITDQQEIERSDSFEASSTVEVILKSWEATKF